MFVFSILLPGGVNEVDGALQMPEVIAIFTRIRVFCGRFIRGCELDFFLEGCLSTA